MKDDKNLPWQKRCELARRLLAEGVLHSKPPWPDRRKRRDFIQKCLHHSGLHGTTFREVFQTLAECVLKGKEEFPGQRVP